MPSLETMSLTDTAVLIPVVQGRSDGFGQFITGTPVEVKVRWLWVTSFFSDPVGNTIQTDARVVLAQDAPVGSRMWLGTLSDFLAAPAGSITIYEVKGFRSTKDVKGRAANTYRGALLARFGQN